MALGIFPVVIRDPLVGIGLVLLVALAAMHESSMPERYDLVPAVTILQMPGGGTRRNPARIASRSGLEQKAVRQRENFRGGMSFAP